MLLVVSGLLTLLMQSVVQACSEHHSSHSLDSLFLFIPVCDHIGAWECFSVTPERANTGGSNLQVTHGCEAKASHSKLCEQEFLCWW